MLYQTCQRTLINQVRLDHLSYPYLVPPMPPLKYLSEHLELFKTIEGNPSLCDLLEKATDDPSQAEFINKLLTTNFNAFSGRQGTPQSLFHLLTTWFAKCPSPSDRPDRFPELRKALIMRKYNSSGHRHRKRDFIKDIGLSMTEDDTAKFIQTIPTIYINRRSKPYPPARHWVVESPEIDARWRQHITEGKQFDLRYTRHPIGSVVNPSNLLYDVKPDESLIIRNKANGSEYLLCNSISLY